METIDKCPICGGKIQATRLEYMDKLKLDTEGSVVDDGVSTGSETERVYCENDHDIQDITWAITNPLVYFIEVCHVASRYLHPDGALIAPIRRLPPSSCRFTSKDEAIERGRKYADSHTAYGVVLMCIANKTPFFVEVIQEREKASHAV